MLSAYVQRILRARIYDVVRESPLERAPRLSKNLDNEIFIKREDEQPVFSFKIRGAYNKLLSLNAEQRARGVIAASAGNHAQGVALGSKRLGIDATIVMPCTTPEIKVRAVQSHGARVVLEGDTYDEACEHAHTLAAQDCLEFIHAYDDPEVIAGQGTVAMELMRQSAQPPDAVFVPVGGGGLIAGIVAYVKSIHPEVKVIGVEPDDAACLKAALEAGERTELDRVGIFADGVAVRKIGEEPFRVLREHVDGVVTVDTDEICAAVKDIFDDNRSVAEPAGALGVAGLKRWVREHGITGQRLVAIETGANMNFDRLRHVAERAEVGEDREALLSVTIPEEPGSFLRFCRALGALPITEFNYRYSSPAEAHVFVGVGLAGGAQDRGPLLAKLDAAGLSALDITDDEMAKLHIRFMVGGHAPAYLHNERLFRFQFPERPGALLDYLQKLGDRWNISLFHYRNHGAAYGRVLVGIQVPDSEMDACRASFDAVGYFYAEETHNPAYQRFLR